MVRHVRLDKVPRAINFYDNGYSFQILLLPEECSGDILPMSSVGRKPESGLAASDRRTTSLSGQGRGSWRYKQVSNLNPSREDKMKDDVAERWAVKGLGLLGSDLPQVVSRPIGPVSHIESPSGGDNTVFFIFWTRVNCVI